MIGDDIASSVNVAGSVGPGCYGIDGSKAHAVGPNKAQDIIGGPPRRVVVIWLLVIDLRHCLHGVSEGRLRDVWMIGRVASDPLRESLLVKRGPELSDAARAA